MENNEMAIRTNDIISSLTYYRLLSSLDIINTELSKNITEAENTNDNIFKKGLVRTKNAIKSQNTERLNKEKAKVESIIEQFKKDCPEDTIYQYGKNEETLKKELEDYLKGDQDDYLRYQVALMSIIDNRYAHPYEEESLAKLSIAIFNDDKALTNIKKKLDKNIKKLISNQSTEEITKMVLISLGISVVATPLVGCAYLNAKSSNNMDIKQLLDNLSAQAEETFGEGESQKKAYIALYALTGGLIALPVTVKEIVAVDKNYKTALRSMKPGDLASTLAIKLTLVELAKDKAPKDKIKEYKEAVLSNAQYIREDCEYLYIVEHNDERDSKSKADICTKAIQCLATL